MANFAVYSTNDLTTYGGMEKVLYLLGNKLLQNGHGFRIASLVQEDSFLKPVVECLRSLKVSRYVIPKTPRPERVYWLFRMLQKKSLIGASRVILEDLEINGVPDFFLVASSEIIPDLALIKRAKNFPFKMVYWDHGWLSGFENEKKCQNPFNFYRFLSLCLHSKAISYALKMTDLHLAISTGIKKLILRFDPDADVKLIYNPVSVNVKKLVSRSSFPTLLYVGRLEDHQKNLTFFLQGLSRLSQKEWILKIIGTGPDEEKLKGMAIQLGINAKIQWLGFKNDPFDSLEECTALILTSRYEGFGLVLVEANAHGIPVISSNCLAGPEDIVIEGINGYLFPEGDLDSFVGILDKLINGELKFASPEEIAKTADRFSMDNYYQRFKEALGI